MGDNPLGDRAVPAATAVEAEPAEPPATETWGITTTAPLEHHPDPAARRPRTMPLSNWPMWVLGLVILMDEMDKNIVRGMITPIQDDLGVNDAAIGLLLAATLLVNGLITVPAGYLADRWNRTRTMGHTIVGWSALTAVGAAAPNFASLVGLRSMLGFGQAITEPSAGSLLGDYYPVQRRGRAFSIQQVMLLAGTGIGVGLGGRLAKEFNSWRWPLVIVAVPGLVVALIVYRLREPKRGAADRMAAGAAELELADERDHVDLFEGGFRTFVHDMIAGLRKDMRTILDIRTMRYALVGVAALLFTITAVAAWLPQYYHRHLYVPEGDAETWFTVLVLIGGIPGVLLGGQVADRFGKRIQGARLALPAIFLFVGNAFFAASYLISTDHYSTSTFATVFALETVGLFVVTMAIPGLRAGLTDAIPAHLRGAGFGAFNLVAVVFGAAAAPLVVSILSSIFDENLRAAFLIVTPAVFVGAGVLFHARKFLDEDMQKIMMAVVVAMQEEQERRGVEVENMASPAKTPS